MNKNQGYYSWIHSLKNAAIQSQQKGFEMLNEQREQGKDVELQRQFLARKKAMGRDTEQGGQNKKKDVKPVIDDANYVEDDAEDGVIGQDAVIPHRENDEPILKVSSSSRSKLPDIQSGAFPPPSVEQPAARFPTPEAAAAEVKRLNAQKDVVATIEAEAEDEQRAEDYDDEERDRQMTIDAQIDRMMGR